MCVDEKKKKLGNAVSGLFATKETSGEWPWGITVEEREREKKYIRIKLRKVR